MRVGTLCYATDQGLGVLAKSFFDGGVVTDVMIVEHHHWPTHREWYPGARSVPIRRMGRAGTGVREFCSGVDTMLFFETPFDWQLFDYCKSKGVKTALMPMYECMPNVWPAQPDIILNPSLLDQEYHRRGQFIPIPVEVPWRLRERAEVFVHNAGHFGLRSRNGTGTILDAMRYVKSPIRLILRAQSKPRWAVDDPRIELRIGTALFSTLWDEGDVFLFPEKFNGLSLPLQEARAAGMLVMATNRFPMNSWLPVEPLVDPIGYERGRISDRCVEFDEAQVSPEALAAKIDEWYLKDITAYSEAGRDWAECMSWEILKPRYLEALR